MLWVFTHCSVHLAPAPDFFFARREPNTRGTRTRTGTHEAVAAHFQGPFLVGDRGRGVYDEQNALVADTVATVGA